MSEENKAIVRRIIEEYWNKGNMTVADELYVADYVVHGPAGRVRSREDAKQMVTMFRTAFHDFRFTIEDVIAEGDKVVVRITLHGTHKGEFQGIAPTGKQVTSTGISIYRIAGGKVVEAWWEWNRMGMMQQLGAIPMPAQGGG